MCVSSLSQLKVFNILGVEVSTLVNVNLTQASHGINFNAKELSSGFYIYT